jgi:cytochrome c-type biogenesis protein CcmH
MVWFWLAVGAMACAATAVLALPLLIGSRRTGSAASPTDEARRLAVYSDRRAEIESERDAGRLTDEEARRALDELIEDAAFQLPASEEGTQAGTRGLGRTQAVLLGLLAALVVPIAALMAYDRLGSPTVAGMDRAALRAGMSPQQRPSQSLAELRDRVRNSPGDAEGWVLLAEAQRQGGDHAAAASSFERASALMPREAWLIAEQAEEVMRAQGGSFAGRPVELLERALAVDPNDNKSVALMGAAQYRLGNREAALVYMKKLAQGMAPGSREAEHIGELIARIEAELGVASGGKPGPMASAPGPSGPAAGGATPGPAAASGGSISGTIDIDASLKAQVPAGATLFVLARGTDGSPIPIAAQRFSADRWPIAFELSDAQAMNPARLLSQAGSVTIEARISRSGTVGRQSGDPFGMSAEVKPGTRDLAVRIDRQVP